MLTLSIIAIVILFLLLRKGIRVFNPYRDIIVGNFWTACAVILVLSMITNPQLVYDGASSGLQLWWNIVFPSLLPFFIASEILMSFGFVHFLGVLMEPVMRPVFNVPGAGSFVVAVGYTSGYPIGAMVTAKLRAQKLCSRVEAERLLCFTNNSSPLFMLVAVPVGMFQNPSLGVIIATGHYLANLTLGLLLRYYCRHDPESQHEYYSHGNIIKRAFAELNTMQRHEQRPLGKILGDAVRTSLNNLLNIGGFIILFAVIIRLLTEAGAIDFFSKILGIILIPLGFSSEILPAVSSGIFEMTIGTKLASEAAASLEQQLMAVAMILAWSGFSIQAQAASMISETDIRLLPYIITRVFHAALAAIYTGLFYHHFYTVQTMAPETIMEYSRLAALLTASPLTNVGACFAIFLSSLIGLVILGIVFYFLSTLRIILIRLTR